MDNKVNAGGNIYLQLFATFFKIGAFTFGGGWAMLSLIEKEIVDKRGWIDRTEYLDLIAVSQSLPGILAVNVSVAVGDKLRGMKGAVTASLGTILPSFMISHIPDSRSDQRKRDSLGCIQGDTSGCRGSDSGSGHIVGALGRHRMAHGDHTCSRGSAHMVETPDSVKPDTLYLARRNRWMVVAVTSSEKTQRT